MTGHEHSEVGAATCRCDHEHIYRPIDTGQSFPALEERVLRWWKERGIFEKSIDLRAGAPEWVFYEGPPTANGRPGVHHVLARVFKDIYTRYRTMRGFYVARKAGWDCHGLPVELEIEKRLGITRKEEIEEFGIAAFNRLCRESVTTYVDEWQRMTERIGFWLDLADAYWTMDDTYVETVWWIISEFAKQDLLYQDYKVVPYCPRCGTALSSHEVALGYQQVVDPSIYVRFPLLDEEGNADGGLSLLVWTTTPWTLISNVAAAVGPTITYARVRRGEERLILAADLVARVIGPDAEVEETFLGSELAGRHYRPPFSFVKPDRDAWYVVTADFVSTDEGTGIVHIAPAFGADDMIVGRANGLPTIMPVDLEVKFTAEVTPYAGLFVKDADAPIIRDLDERGLLYAHHPYEHSYPHCWRCDTPLIYYAKSSWYIHTTARKDALLGANEEVSWYPDNLKYGRFGNWLENNVDWSLSRERYWGTPLPIWRCPNRHDQVVGSRAELSRLTGSDLSDLELHRPYIDEVVFSCPVCGEEARRVPEVVDAWFDSGSMPMAQWHYPFENQEIFLERFPADFICEAIDQTRGWFYSMLAISALLWGHTSYVNVVCLGHVLDADGRKMSKSLGNVVDPWTVLESQGADALRWYFYSASSPWFPRRFSPQNVDEVIRRFTLTLWNTYSFYTLYANIDSFDPRAHQLPAEERSLMDRWILAELNILIKEVTAGLEQYDAFSTSRAIAEFVDELSNWYVRRSRRRFWKSEEDSDKVAAYLTLYECLQTLSKLIAPYMPFLAEDLYQNLVSERYPSTVPESVHLCDWPSVDEGLIDSDLSYRMRLARRVVNMGRAARNNAQIKTRQPLQAAVVTATGRERDALRSLEEVVSEELNVKEIGYVDSAGELVTYVVKPNYRTLGPRFGKAMPEVAAAVAGLAGDQVAARIEDGLPVAIAIGGKDHELTADELIIESHQKESLVIEQDGNLVVGLSTSLTLELKQEGLARELVHHVQNTRKSADFQIEDRISLTIEGPEEIVAMAERYRDWIMKETLSTSLLVASAGRAETEPGYRERVKVNGLPVTITVERVER